VKKVLSTVLVVGLGSIGRRHIGIINDIFPDINIILLRHKKCSEKEYESLKISQCVTTINDAIKTKPQAAIIANPASKHVEIAKELASNGIDVLVEKPISSNSKDAKELIEVCEKNNTILMVAYNLRFLPSLINFKQCIYSNLIGRVYSTRSEIGQYLPSWRPESDYRHGVSAKKSLGGGVLLELSHEIDYLKWIFGSITWIKSHTSKLSDLEVDVDDSASIILSFRGEDGGEIISSLNMDFIRRDATRKCYAIGEKGTLYWNGITGKVKLFSELDNHWIEVFNSPVERDYTYTEEIKSFFSSVESRIPSSVTGRDALETVLTVEAIEYSSFTNSRVVL
jgi:predicted dehydrogenase